MWVEESVAGKIDPSVVMCIGLAESSLGRHLKTPYNIGNVGNTDDGSTYQFDSPRSGVYWVVRTLNNDYLKNYTSIDQLSRYGNKTGPIYASSDTNWHNNMVNCLSALKGRYVGDEYPFRLGGERDISDIGNAGDISASGVGTDSGAVNLNTTDYTNALGTGATASGATSSTTSTGASTPAGN